MIHTGRRTAKDDKYGTRGIKIQLYGRATTAVVPYRRGFNDTGIRMPELRNFSANTKNAIGRIKLPSLVGNKIDIGIGGGTMCKCQLGGSRLAEKLKIRSQALAG